MSKRAATRWWVLVLVAALALAATPFAFADDHDDGGKGKAKAHTYRVTIRNLTSGQPLSPPVVATHRGDDQLFEVGEPASVGVREIAENGNNAPILAFLEANPFGTVSDFASS